MAQDQKRRQKALEKKNQKRKEHARATRAVLTQSPGSRGVARLAANWPIIETLVSAEWADEGAIVQVLIARESPVTGEVGAAAILVDLGLLGVKDAALFKLPSRVDYENAVRATVTARQVMMDVSLDLAARIIRAGIDYADSFGFKPHPDFAAARPMLTGADPDADSTPIPVGSHADGKPMYIVGPHDPVRTIFARLNRQVGPTGYHYLGPPEMVGPHLFAGLSPAEISQHLAAIESDIDPDAETEIEPRG